MLLVRSKTQILKKKSHFHFIINTKVSYINNLHDNIKRNFTDVGLHGQNSDLQNEAIETKFRHLVVKYQPNNIRALDYKQPHSHITGQNRLQTPGAPTRSALGSTSSMMRCPRKPIGPHPPRSTSLFKWIHPQSQKPIRVIGRGPITAD
ncbi:hypothetical protein M9H77_19901 [Catharanthus roseus]|uniref:Uncharacterized protein n=1 Tax=Catharanthus roseus TaxID=4058 RepID=A0ACC0BBQ1_CATRO|nr:hypothetical protein M9H77_19901 [Catharanthus roseus]